MDGKSNSLTQHKLAVAEPYGIPQETLQVSNQAQPRGTRHMSMLLLPNWYKAGPVTCFSVVSTTFDLK